MNPRCTIAAIILAGGASRRMGSPKALLKFRDETFLDRMIRLFADVTSPIVVVLGYHSDRIRAGLAPASQHVTFAINPDPERGMLSSLQCGLENLPADIDAVMFTPVDHPHLQSSTLETIASRFATDRAPVTAPTHNGRHGHPVCIARPLIEELLALPATAMATDIIHRYADRASYVEVDDPGATTDVDDPEAYAGLLAQHP